MKVQFLSGPKIGTVEHLPAHICQPLIAAGICKQLVYSSYQERLSEEAAQGNDPHNVSATVVGVEWAVLDKDGSFQSVVRVVKKENSTTTYYSDCPPDAPASTRQQFNELTKKFADGGAVGCLEKANRAKAQYEESVKFAKRF